jgi:cytochrome c
MNRTCFLAMALGIALCSAPAFADEALAKAKGCTACHSIDKKLIGPAYKDVAKKYKADKDGVAKMVASITKGSTGKWGQVPMPANNVTPDEAAKLAAWIRSL